jgi:DNA polymerase III sliding clamp (beta) subunit (PCNA family)
MTTAITFELPRNDLLQALDRLTFCISADKMRPQICGMLLEAADTPGHVRLVATDGHRLGCADVHVAGDDPQKLPSRSIIMPPKVVSTLIDELPTRPEDVATIGVEDNSLKVECGNLALKAELVAETYPDYRNRALPSADTFKSVEVSADAGELFAALEGVTDVEGSTLVLEVRRDRIVILSEDGAASIRCSVRCKPQDWEEFKIRFNRNYLMDVCDVLRGASECTGPAVFETAAIPGLFYLVMPMAR